MIPDFYICVTFSLMHLLLKFTFKLIFNLEKRAQIASKKYSELGQTNFWGKATDRLMKGLLSFVGLYLTEISSIFILSGLFILVSYSFDFYSSIPQEFGGVKPRCAYIDSSVSQLSNETIETLFPHVTPAISTEYVAQSTKLNVFLSTKDSLLVAPYQEKPTPHDKIFEIPSTAIKTITWCENYNP